MKAAEYYDQDAKIDAPRHFLWPKISLTKKTMGYRGYVVTEFGVVGIDIDDDKRYPGHRRTVLVFACGKKVYKRTYLNRAFTKRGVTTKARRFAFKIWKYWNGGEKCRA